MNPLSAAAAEAPNTPGVYFFLGARTDLLYVGKAGSLRQRLQQHAQINPDEGGWLHQRYKNVCEVRWEELPDEDSAAAREADLIVALRPPFNANWSQGRWAYIMVQRTQDANSMRFEVSPERSHRAARAYGCFPHLGRGVTFRSAIACSDGYVALLRLIWAVSGRGTHIPSRITRSAPDFFETAVHPSLNSPLHAFLSGTSSRLLGELTEGAQKRDGYMQPGFARDRKAAHSFFIYGPRALRSLRLRHRRLSGPMTRTVIEDFLVAEVRASIGEFRIPVPSPAYWKER